MCLWGCISRYYLLHNVLYRKTILETDANSTESTFKLSNRTNLNTVKTLFKNILPDDT